MVLPVAMTTTGGGGTTEQNLHDNLRDARYNIEQALERILLAMMAFNGSGGGSCNGALSNPPPSPCLSRPLKPTLSLLHWKKKPGGGTTIM